MIRMNLKPVVYALTIGSAALSTAGSNGSEVDSPTLGGSSPAQYASGSGSNASADHPSHAEARHFAIYSAFRSMPDSSGGSGAGSAGSADSVPDDKSSGNFLLWGSRLFGVEHLFCPAGEVGK
jgi:hypothetical protein